MSNDMTPEHSTARPAGVIGVDYGKLVEDAWSLHKYRCGTPTCIAFKNGAEWQAKQAPQPAQAVPAPEPEVWLYDFMYGATTVRNWSTTNKAEAFAPGNFNQRGYVPAEN